jgi:hypothetical protein
MSKWDLVGCEQKGRGERQKEEDFCDVAIWEFRNTIKKTS